MSELNAVVRLAEPPCPGGERRASLRYPVSTPVKSFCQPQGCGAANEDCWWQARVRNLSADGIGLALLRRFEPGTDLAIEMESAAGGPPPLLLRARVVRAEPLARGWLIGCVFPDRLSEDHLLALLGRAAP